MKFSMENITHNTFKELKSNYYMYDFLFLEDLVLLGRSRKRKLLLD